MIKIYKKNRKLKFTGNFIILGLILCIFGLPFIINPQSTSLKPIDTWNLDPKTQLTINDFNSSLIFGTAAGPLDIDPHLVYDESSYNVIEQVCEGLFINDYNDPDLGLIPALAKDFGDWNGNNYTVDLRNGVLFHDGSTFDAYDVVWSFERLQYLISQGVANAYTLYEYYDINYSDYRPIINETIALDSDTIKFVLNTAYGPFEQLLAFPGSFILPSEGQIPFDSPINPFTDDLIGTGPFDFIQYQENDYVKFIAFENYWRANAAITNLTYKIIANATLRNQALLNGSVDIINQPDPTFLDSFESSDEVELINSGKSSTMYYLGMNTKLIPVDVRRGISYAINYTHIINNIYPTDAERLESPIPEGIKYANWSSFDVPVLNITEARLAMQDAGYGIGLDPTYGGPDDTLWRESDFVNYNFTYILGNTLHENLLVLLQNNLTEIGIVVTDGGLSVFEYFQIIFNEESKLNLFWSGWVPDYNDPNNVVYPLFTNFPDSVNPTQLNDTLIETLIEAALVETDPSLREFYYDFIQERLIEVLYPYCWTLSPVNYDAFRNKVKNFPSNIFDRVYFYPCYVEQDYPNDLVFGTYNGPNEIDPHAAYEYNSYDVIEQVCEGLFIHNYSDPDLGLIPALANDFGVWNGNNYTVDLRNGVLFHDGSTFDAYDVVWTFERLENLSSQGKISTYSLYEYYDIANSKYRPIINKTIAIDSDTIRFVLNTHYSPFEELLAFTGSFILPSEGQVPFEELLDPLTDDLIGTGPYDYIYYRDDIEVRFDAFTNYWRGKASIDRITFRIIQDSYERNQALLDERVDLIMNPNVDYLPSFNSSNKIELVDGGLGSSMYYIGMNTKLIPVDVRRGISYAINYTHIINNIYPTDAERLESPIPEGIKYANWSSFDVPVLNITKARLAMQDAGYGIGLDPIYGGPDDTLWRESNFLTYNFTYILGNTLYENLLTLLQNNLTEIGIVVTDGGSSPFDYFEAMVNEKSKLNLFWSAWAPDYNDPNNVLYPLFTDSPDSFNPTQVNDTLIQTWIEAALVETNSSLRENYYDLIQERLIEVIYPNCWLLSPINYDAYDININNFSSNIFDRPYFFQYSWNLPSITNLYPLNQTYSNSILQINVSVVSENTNITRVIAELDGSELLILNHSNEGLYIYNTTEPTILSEGTHSIKLWAFDSNGNYGTTEILYFSIQELSPSVEIISPENEIYNHTNLDINVTCWDSTGISEVVAEIDTMTNITLNSDSGNLYYYNDYTFSKGLHSIRIYALDIVGNCNDTEIITFQIDSTGPSVEIISPVNKVYQTNLIDIHTFCSDSSGISQVVAEIDAMTNITLNSGGGNLYYYNDYTFSDGFHSVRIYAFDLLDNSNITEDITFQVDTTQPSVDLISPENEIYNQSSIDINVTCWDSTGISQVIAEIDNITNVTLSSGGGLLYYYNDYTFSDGLHSIRIYAFDSVNNLNDSESTSFQIDTKGPSVDIISPENKIYNFSFIDINVSCWDASNISQVIAEVDNITNVTLNSGGGSFYYYNDFLIDDGLHSIKIYAFDSVKNLNNTEIITFQVNTTDPLIEIISPVNKFYDDQNIVINVSCWDSTGISQVIAEIDNISNVTLIQGEGNLYYYTDYAFSEGSHTIEFYAFNNLGYLIEPISISFSVDTIDPVILIEQPQINSEFGETAPGYVISITEPNLDTIWYTMNGGEDLFIISSLSGALNQSVWNQLPDSQVTLIFYANDTVGHISMDQVIIIKDAAPDFEEIPGFDIIIILGILGIMSLLIYRKKLLK